VEIVAESHQPEVLREMVRLGIGWTVLPITQAEREPTPLRRARRAPLTTRTLVAARRADALDNPAADRLLSRLQPGAT
jgi:DNA-binding transcriptional LysR family regulator